MSMTTSQTIGPFFQPGLQWGMDGSIGLPADGPRIIVEGAVIDGAGDTVIDALIEAWNPAAASESAGGMPGFRRADTVHGGRFRLELSGNTAPGEPVAYITVFARGLLSHQFTAVFIADDAASAMLAQVPAERRATLIARQDAAGVYQWDIHLQGERETVFFDYR